jgi:hypothetical protein
VWCNGNIIVLGTVAVGSSPTTLSFVVVLVGKYYWGVLELVDRLVLGTSAKACGFKSLRPHNIRENIKFFFFCSGVSKWPKGGDCKSFAQASQVRILPPRKETENRVR